MKYLTWMRELLRQRANQLIAGALIGYFVIGVVVGLVLLGWYVWPVTWVDASPAQLAPEHQAAIVEFVADLYAYSGDGRKAAWLATWGGDKLACNMAWNADDAAAAARLVSVAYAATGVGCSYDN